MKSVLISIRPEWCDKIASGEKTIEIRKSKPKLKPPFKCYIYCTKAKHYFAEYGLYGDELFRIPTGEVKFGCSMEISCYDGPNKYNEDNFLNGKVIGEFVCDCIEEFESEFYSDDSVLNAIYRVVEDEDFPDVLTAIASNEDDSKNFWICAQSCLSFDEIKEYVGYEKSEKTFYGWHISDLVIYDKPKELSEFHKPSAENMEELLDCEILCDYCYETGRGEYAFTSTPNGPVMCEGAYCDRAYQSYLDDEGFTLYRPPSSWRYVEEGNG